MAATFGFLEPFNNLVSATSPSTVQRAADVLSYGRTALVLGTITGDASYATGGYAISPANFNLSSLTAVFFDGGDGVHTAVYNASTGKVQFFTAGAEVANATNVSAVEFHFIALGLM